LIVRIIMTKRMAVIIQARMGSTRLPNKVLTDIEGHPMLWHLIQRLKFSKYTFEIIIATTNSDKDKLILKFSEDVKVKSYAGSEEDVLDRYYKAALKYKVNIIIRITSDCPLIDSEICDKVIKYYLENNFDYVSNTNPPTFPDGLDVEILNFKVLKKAWKEAKLKSEREHVTSYIWKNSHLFKFGNVTNNQNLSQMRWTVDEKEDLEFVREIYKNLYSKKPNFLMIDILNILKEKPELLKINNQYTRNEGYLKSIKTDGII